MQFLYYLNVTIHVLSAMLWLGGMFFLGLVGAPVIRSIQPPELRRQLFHQLGLRFRTVGWWAIAVLLVTGVMNLHLRGWLQPGGPLTSAAFWGSPVGRVLAVKLVVVFLMILISALHDFVLGPRAGREMPQSAGALRRGALVLGRVNVLLGIALVIAAVRLAR